MTPTPTTPAPNHDNSIRVGIRCPKCNCGHHSVTHTYASEVSFDGIKRQYIRRRRECRYCGWTWHTREVAEPELPDNVKHPQQAQEIRRKVSEVLDNLIPEKNLPDLENPFL